MLPLQGMEFFLWTPARSWWLFHCKVILLKLFEIKSSQNLIKILMIFSGDSMVTTRLCLWGETRCWSLRILPWFPARPRKFPWTSLNLQICKLTSELPSNQFSLTFFLMKDATKFIETKLNCSKSQFACLSILHAKKIYLSRLCLSLCFTSLFISFYNFSFFFVFFLGPRAWPRCHMS